MRNGPTGICLFYADVADTRFARTHMYPNSGGKTITTMAAQTAYTGR